MRYRRTRRDWPERPGICDDRKYWAPLQSRSEKYTEEGECRRRFWREERKIILTIPIGVILARA